MRRVVLAAPGVVAAACFFPDVGGLGSDASTLPDVMDGGAFDVAADVAPVDAPSEASDAGADAEAGYCASLSAAHTFCDDFDEAPYATGFPNLHLSKNAAMGSDGAEVVSAPSSFFATISPETTLGDDAFMVRSFASGSAMTYSFDLRIDEWSTGHSGVFAAIVVNDGLPTLHTLSAYTTDTYAALEEDVPGDAGSVFLDHTFTTTVPLGAWVRISFTADLVARTCSATMNGATVVATTSMAASWAPGPLEINVGFVYVGGELQGWKGRWDNLLVDVTP